MISAVVKENQMLGVTEIHDAMKAIATTKYGTSLVTS